MLCHPDNLINSYSPVLLKPVHTLVSRAKTLSTKMTPLIDKLTVDTLLKVIRKFFVSCHQGKV